MFACNRDQETMDLCGKIIDANPVLHVSVKFTEETVERQSMKLSVIVNVKQILADIAIIWSLN